MRILVFDTETTGFINKKEINDLTKQPYIVQFAWIVWEIKDWEFIEEKRINKLIKPKISIPYESSQVHHIYDVDVKDANSIEEEIEWIMDLINWVDVIVWHNIEYDEEMIKLELRRLDLLYKYAPKQVICTMKTTVDFCALLWKWERFKYPKLWELYKKLFDEYFMWAHDAMIDVEATVRCFTELVNKWVIKIEKNDDSLMSLF